jgi:hypothetical protein
MLRIFAALVAISALVACSSSETATPAADAGPRCDYSVSKGASARPADNLCPAACPQIVGTSTEATWVFLCTTACTTNAACPANMRCDTNSSNCRFPCSTLADCPSGMLGCGADEFCR